MKLKILKADTVVVGQNDDGTSKYAGAGEVVEVDDAVATALIKRDVAEVSSAPAKTVKPNG